MPENPFILKIPSGLKINQGMSQKFQFFQNFKKNLAGKARMGPCYALVEHPRTCLLLSCPPPAIAAHACLLWPWLLPLAYCFHFLPFFS